MTDADRIKELERENADLRTRLTKKKRPALDEMTLAEMEQLASRVSAAVAALREARPFMGGESPRSAAPAADVEGPVPLRPPPPPIDHPRAKGKVVLSPEEEGRKRALLRANRGDDVKESA